MEVCRSLVIPVLRTEANTALGAGVGANSMLEDLQTRELVANIALDAMLSRRPRARPGGFAIGEQTAWHAGEIQRPRC